MIQRLRLFFISQKAFSVFFAFLGIYLVAFFWRYFFQYSLIDFVKVLGGLFFFIFGTGVAITLIVQWLTRRNFGKWEFISLSLLAGITIQPALLEIEFIIYKYVYDWFPIANAVILWIIAGILLFCKKTYFNFSFDLKKINPKSPLFLVLTFGFIFTFVQVLMYKTLPDLDPYKWLLKYIYQFANQQLDYTERPLFGAIVFIGTRFTGINLEAFFKYILPFLNLIILFPAWMVARGFKDIKKQWFFLLFTFVSPAAILYTQSPIPQATLFTVIYFIVFFLVYSSEKNDRFFFYISGIIAFLSFFIHQSGAILFAIWMIVFVISDYKKILADKKTFALIILLVATNLFRVETMINFALSWINTIISSFFSSNNFNFLYPFQYGNVDKTTMGWGSFDGVLKFYAFYMGPAVGTLLLSFSVLFLKNRIFRSFVINKIRTNLELISASLMFLAFFSIAEILPRFPNIALLPDRAWVFAGIFSLALLFLILKQADKISTWVMVLSFILWMASISGGLYINYSKRYLITPAQIESAEWIKNNLPETRLFLSYGHKSLLPIYADSPVAIIPSETYCSKNENYFENILGMKEDNENKKNNLNLYKTYLDETKMIIEGDLKKYAGSKSNDEKYREALNNLNNIAGSAADLQIAMNHVRPEMLVIYPPDRIPALSAPLPIEEAYVPNGLSGVDIIENNPIYVYFAKKNKLNPYYDRPYEMQTWGIKSCPDGKFLFDLYPDKFKRIYSINNEEVIIWKVL